MNTSALYDPSSSPETDFVPNITSDSTRSAAMQETPNEAVTDFIQWFNLNLVVCIAKIISKEELIFHTENQPVVVREPLVGYKDTRLQKKAEDATTVDSLSPELETETDLRIDPAFQDSIITESIYPLDREGDLSADSSFFNILSPLEPDEVVDLNLLCISQKGYRYF